LSEVSNSGNLLRFNRTEAVLALDLSASVPCVIGIIADGPAFCGCGYAGLSHYAAVWFAKSTRLERKREVQSTGIS